MDDDSWEIFLGILISMRGDPDPGIALLSKLIDCAQKGRNPKQCFEVAGSCPSWDV